MHRNPVRATGQNRGVGPRRRLAAPQDAARPVGSGRDVGIVPWPGDRCVRSASVHCSFRRQERLHRAALTRENGYGDSFDAKLRDELLDGEIFYSLAESRIVIDGWCRHDNTKRPTSSVANQPPAPEVVQ
ncbi:hypothetical protein DR046_17235 [Jannaschia formosa]|nr:hypothetical protein DR046_17235 [Jannaschia formosa]